MKLVIDFAAIGYALRRALFALRGRPAKDLHCRECGVRLTYNEVEYYGSTCNRCEGRLSAKWNELDPLHAREQEPTERRPRVRANSVRFKCQHLCKRGCSKGAIDCDDSCRAVGVAHMAGSRK